MSDPDRLATYGTLAPGRSNHHLLDGLAGRWLHGHVHGALLDQGWGAAQGFPALVVDPAGARVDVEVFESRDLRDHWRRLDEFEGPGYQRLIVTVHCDEGELEAYLYALNQDTDGLSKPSGCAVIR